MVIRKRNNGSWDVDVSNGYDPITLKQRRIIRKGYKTKKEAIEAETFLRTVELKKNKYGTKATIPLLYNLLKEEDVINQRKISYINTQENNYNKHIKDYFSKLNNVGKLTYEDIYEFREHLRKKRAKNSEKKLSTNTINKIMILLKKILDVGIRKGYYTQNPVNQLKKLPIVKPQIKYWTIQEFHQFHKLFTVEEYHLKLLFTVLYFTGMRLGEALALTWEDIDLNINTIFVTKSIYTKDKVSHISTTKTRAGTRRIILNKKLITELETWKEKQFNLLKAFTKEPLKLKIFQNSPVILTKDSIEKQYKKILSRDRQLKKIRIHDFRHSHASLLINQGEDYHIVKERLGHASITTTIDTYSHLYPSKQKDLAEKLDDLL
ncbi:tyrosine-type recombinase/integrase [Streptococcus suis]|nr:tyrosine-type recombinase/integrase [Streptococcus suis]